MAAIRMLDPPCKDAADFDDSGSIGLPDLLGQLAFLFQQGPPPAPPYPDCGYDTTEDNLNCNSFPPCEPDRVRTLSDGPGLVGPPEEAIQLLSSTLSQDGTLLAIPIALRSSRGLAAFEFTVSFDPAVLQFAGLDESGRQSGSLDFFAANTEGMSGHVRVGGVPDLRFENLRQEGNQQLGRLLFQIRGASGVGGTRIDVIDGILIADDLSATGVTRSATIVSFDAAGAHPGSEVEPRLTFTNPLRPGSAISLDLPVASPVTVAIYNVTGQIVKTLTMDLLSSGHHEFDWDGRTEPDQEAAPGIYYVRATVGSKQIHRTIALVR